MRGGDEEGTKSRLNTEVMHCKPRGCKTLKTFLRTVEPCSSPMLNLNMTTDRPTILLAHGAWHPPHLYVPLKDALASRGYALIAPALPTMGTNSTGIGWEADTKALMDGAEPLFT